MPFVRGGWALAGLSMVGAVQDQGSPIAKVIQMVSELQTKVIGEGEAAQKEFDTFSEWCEDQSKTLSFEIKTGKAGVEELTATIEEETSHIAALKTKVGELADGIAKDEAELKAATEVRAAEHSDFVAEDKELVETIDTLERAMGILEREMAKGGASMMQLKSAGSVVQALGALVQASAINSADAARLTALVQSSQAADDD